MDDYSSNNVDKPSLQETFSKHLLQRREATVLQESNLTDSHSLSHLQDRLLLRVTLSIEIVAFVPLGYECRMIFTVSDAEPRDHNC